MTASDVVTDFSITPNTGERVLMALAACGYNAPTRAPRISEEQKKALQCGVCLEVMTKPVSTPCGHNFCANCLRHAMICAPRCPLCREQLHGMVFRVNHMLQDMITMLDDESVRVPPAPTTLPMAWGAKQPTARPFTPRTQHALQTLSLIHI